MKYDNFWQWLAWKLPRKLVAQCGYRIGAHATMGKFSTQVVKSPLTFMDAMERWYDD